MESRLIDAYTSRRRSIVLTEGGREGGGGGERERERERERDRRSNKLD